MPAVLLLAICHVQFAGIKEGKSRMMYPGCVTPVTQVITYPNYPATLIGTLATGGNCGSSYAYQWMSSNDGTNYTLIAGATGQNLTFIAVRTAATDTVRPASAIITPTKTYYIRRATCGSEVRYTASVTITRQ